MRRPGPGPLLLLVLAALPGVSRPADPILTELAAIPEPGLKAVRLRAVLRTSGLDRSVLLNFAVGARGASVRIEPGGDPSGTIVERVVYPARVKLWTPAKPVMYQLEATVESRGRHLERTMVRFPIRSVAVRDGTVMLNGARLPVRGAVIESGDTLADDLKRLHAEGFNLVRLGAIAASPKAREWCDANGLLVWEDLAPPPALATATVAPAAVPPDPAALAARGLLPAFGTATVFAGACRAWQAERVRRRLEDLRLDPESPGYLVAGWRGFADAVGHAHAPWLLAARPSHRLFAPGTAPLMTLLLTGPAAMPRDGTIEWRLVEPETCGSLSRTVPGRACPPPPAKPAWKPAPRLSAGSAGAFGAAGAFGETAGPAPTASAAFALPAVTRAGHWVFEARLRRRAGILAEARESFEVAPEPSLSQISFALVGEAPELERAFGAWIIPADQSPVAIVVHPARCPADALRQAVRRLNAGGKVVFLELDAEDAAALNGLNVLPWTLTLTGAPPLTRAHYLRPGGAVGPGASRGSDLRWLPHEGYEPLLPELSLSDIPGATVFIGAAPAGPGFPGSAGDPGWLTDAAVVPVGAGRAVFCQLRLLDHLDQGLAKTLLWRLLAP